jgi:hypothetical protein
MQRAAWREDGAQRSETRVRVGEMMEHPGANDLVEDLAELAYALDRELVETEVA